MNLLTVYRIGDYAQAREVLADVHKPILVTVTSGLSSTSRLLHAVPAAFAPEGCYWATRV